MSSHSVNDFFNAFRFRQHPVEGQILRHSYYQEEGTELKKLLASKTSEEMNLTDIRTVVEGKLWMLSPEAYLYFLPAFLNASLQSYRTISVFVSELIGSLTNPLRTDILEAFDRLKQNSHTLSLSDHITEAAKDQQIEWFDSGTPNSIFLERFEKLTGEEGVAILSFIKDLKMKHGEDFPFNELDIAIKRFWNKYSEH